MYAISDMKLQKNFLRHQSRLLSNPRQSILFHYRPRTYSSIVEPDSFGSSRLWPILKVFLYATFINMTLHLIWWKLRTDELNVNLRKEIDVLKTDLYRLVDEKDRQLKESATIRRERAASGSGWKSWLSWK
ncbi:hypothetical protein V1511DRAFT_486713 [Dipodascopsis uninucleata]